MVELSDIILLAPSHSQTAKLTRADPASKTAEAYVITGYFAKKCSSKMVKLSQITYLLFGFGVELACGLTDRGKQSWLSQKTLYASCAKRWPLVDIVPSKMVHVKHIIVSCSDLESRLPAPSHKGRKAGKSWPSPEDISCLQAIFLA